MQPFVDRALGKPPAALPIAALEPAPQKEDTPENKPEEKKEETQEPKDEEPTGPPDLDSLTDFLAGGK